MQHNPSDVGETGDLFLSVIIPLYNKELSVGRAIASVLAQHYSSFELLVIDDGSTDESYERAAEFTDPRVRLIRQSNQGVAAARNQGMSQARGKYLCFLDADDQYLPEFLSQMACLIRQAPEAALYSCRFDIVDEHGRMMQLNSGFAPEFAGSVADFFTAYRQNRSLICASSFAIRRELLLAIGGFPAGIRIGEDIFVWLQAALTGPMMYSAKTAAVVYQNAENRTVHQQTQELAWHLVYFLRDRYWTQHLPSEKVQQIDRFIRHNVLVAAFGALRFGRCDVARGYAGLLRQQSMLMSLLIQCGSYLPPGLYRGLRLLRNYLTTNRPRPR